MLFASLAARWPAQPEDNIVRILADRGSVSIDRIRPADEASLGDLFEEFAADTEIVQFFHPHPLTRNFATWLCGPEGPRQDRYFLARREQRLVGYSMLRGWDAGYSIPSFGNCVCRSARGLGIGRLLLAHAIEEARTAGASRLRLSVYRSNYAALHIYSSFGFSFEEKNALELVGWLSLATTEEGTLHSHCGTASSGEELITGTSRGRQT
jgi:ribosomal protein S18 acetylase RimI-like enzyme